MTAHSNKAERRCAAGVWGNAIRGSLVGIVTVSLLLGTAEAADDDAKAAVIEPVVVDPSNTAEWPDGDWVPVRGRELNALLERAKPQPDKPRKSWIERATYSATFDLISHSLRGGRLSADVRHDGQRPELLSLEPMNLAVAEMNWVNQPAIWGTLGDGRSALFVNGKHSTLTGRWNLTGRKLPRSVEFDIQIPKASVNRIRLIVPHGFVVSVSTGQSRWLDDDEESALRQWELDLGSQTACRITIRQRPDQSEVSPLMLSESTHTFVFRETGVQLQAEFVLEAANAPVNLLLFEIPGGIDVSSVSYGSNRSLAWRVVPSGDDQLLAFQLPDLLSGSGRPIRIAGTAALTLGKMSQLPQLRLKSAVNTPANLSEMPDASIGGKLSSRPGNAVFLGGNLHLKFESPLELQSIEPSGYRQTAAVSTRDVSNALSFQQYEQPASLKLEVDFPKLRQVAEVFTVINTQSENWSIAAHATLSVEAGETFEADFHLAPMWEVVEVRSLDANSTLANWTVRRRRGGARTLSIEFRDVISAGSPKAIEIVGHRIPLPRKRPLRLPVLRPLDHRADEQLVAVMHTSGAVPVLDSGSIFRRTERAKVPEFVVDSQLWPLVKAEDPEQVMLLDSRNAAGETRLRLDQVQAAVDTFVWSQTVLDSSALNESWRVRLRPRGNVVDRTNIYVSTAGDDIAWTLDSPDPVALTATRVPLDRFRDWNLPAGGELWEIQLPQSLRSEFTIVGTRKRNLDASMMPALATVPGSHSFRGVAELQIASNLNVEIDTNGLEPTGLDAINDADFPLPGPVERIPSSQLWEFDTPESSLLLRLHRGLDESARRRTAGLRLQSILADEFPGFDHHLARLTLLESGPSAEIRFDLPRPAVLLSTKLNDKLVTPHRKGGKWVVASTDEIGRAVLEIEYQSPSTAESFLRTHEIPQPVCDYAILEFDWEFAVPADVWVSREPSGLLLRDRLPQLSWSERFFGPLGRPVGRAMFNPFAADSWVPASTDLSTPTDKQAPASSTFAPTGWRVIRATAPDVPAKLEISTRRHSQAWVLAWIFTLGCLLGGLLMRVRLWTLRSSVFGIWLTICLCAAWLSPPFYALMAGGSVVGSIVALLFPRRLLNRLRFGKKSVDAVPSGSTASFRRFPAVPLLLLVGLSAGHTVGQEAASPDSAASAGNGAARQSVRVLVSKAVEPTGLANDELVFVEREALAQLRTRDREATAAYLVSAADYSARVDEQQSVRIEANYKIHLLPSVRRARVAFPNVGANPASCRVNGKLQPIVLSRNGEVFHVELTSEDSETSAEGMAEYDVRLEFRPATSRAGAESGYLLNTIPVASARLEQQFSQPLPTMEVIGARGQQVVAADRRSMTALLGKTDRFQVLWSPNAESRQTRAVVEADAITHVTAQPTWLELRYRVDYRVLNGQVDFVSWNLPHGVHQMVVREVLFDGIPVKNFSTTIRNRQTSRLLVELAAPQRQAFSVEALVIVPVKSSQGVIPVRTASLVAESAQGYSIVPKRHVVGIDAPIEFELSQPVADELVKGVREISAEDFADFAGGDSGMRPVRFAYEVEGDGKVVAMQLQPTKPVRKVRMIQTGVVRGDVLEWSLTADLETSRAPVFRHRLLVPKEFQVAEISVREDDVERLVHWSRRGDTVEMFLSDKSNGAQSLTLSGERRLPLSKAVSLPLIEFEESDVLDTRLRLLQDHDVDVQLFDLASLERIESGISPVEAGDDVELVGQYRIVPDVAPARIRVETSANDPSVEPVIRISRLSPREWQIAYRYVFRGGAFGEPVDVVRLQIPRQIANRVRVDSPGAQVTRTKTVRGDIEFSCQPKSKLSTSLEVNVTATIEEPPPGIWSLPRIRLDDVSAPGATLLIAADLSVQPAVPHVEAIPPQAVPMQYRLDAETLDGDVGWKAYRLSGDDVEFSVGLPDTESLTTRIPYAETRVVFADDGTQFGRSVFWVANLVEDDFELSFPPGLKVRALFVDGQLSTVFHHDVDTRTLSIPISARRKPRQIDLSWMQVASQSSSRATRLSQQLPTPRAVEVERDVISIVPLQGRLFAARNDVKSTTELEQAVDKLRVLADLVGSQGEQASNLFLWRSLERQRQLVHDYLARSRQDGTLNTEEAEQAKQFELLDAEIGQLRTEFAEAANEAASQMFESEMIAGGRPLLTAAPNRWTLSGVVSASPTDSASSIAIWNIGEWWVVAMLLLLGLPLILVVRWLVKLEIGPWLYRHQPAAWTLLGLFWWTCLRPSEFGFALLFVALVVAVLDRRRIRAETDFVVDIAGGDSDVHATSMP